MMPAVSPTAVALNAGVTVFFRRHQSPFPAIEATLEDIIPDAEYEVGLSPAYEGAPRQRTIGKQFMRLPIAISEKPGGLLLRYTSVS